MSRQRQRGAAALMIVLFLLVVGSVAVLTALSTSGSDSGDTAYQHNSVAALDLAESSLERVAGRLSTGAACASLGTEGPYSLGQGTFSIVTPAPYVDIGWCRVRVSGSVGTVTRIIDAWLNAGIVLEQESDVSATTATLTFPHTVAGTNRLLVVAVAVDQARTMVSTVKYAGVSMGLTIGAGTGGNPRSEIYSLLNPPTGTNNVVVTLTVSDQLTAGALSFRGVDVVTPIEATALLTGNSLTASVSITPLTNNAWIVDALAADKGVSPTLGTVSPAPAGANRTQQWNLSVGTSITGAASLYGPVNPAGTETLTWTLSTAKKWAHAAATIKPSGKPQVVRWSEVIN